MRGLIGLVFVAVFILPIGFFIHTFVRCVAEARGNKKLPFETSTVRVVAKYTEGSESAGDTEWPATCHVTFEDESGARHRFAVSDKEYASIKEGEWGTLTRQGTDYKGFVPN